MVLVVKSFPANAGDTRHTGLIPGLGRTPGGGLGTHSSILAWRIPWTEAPGRQQSMGCKESDTTEDTKHPPFKDRDGTQFEHRRLLQPSLVSSFPLDSKFFENRSCLTPLLSPRDKHSSWHSVGTQL